MTWQPISTAPKDGTEFLAWSEAQGFDVVQSFEYEREDGSHAWFNGDVYVNPTHWMPLPEPPNPPKEDK